MSPIGTGDEAYEVGSIDVEFLLSTLAYGGWSEVNGDF